MITNYLTWRSYTCVMDSDFKTDLGKVLKSLRKDNGLTQEQLGLMVGVNRLTIRRIEYGTANPTLDVLLKLCSGLGVRFPDLVAQTDGSKKPSTKLQREYEVSSLKKRAR